MTHLAITQQITFLYTRSLAATAHFYEDIVGLPLILDQGNCRIYQLSGDGYLGFCQRDDAPQPPSGIMITIVTPQVDQWYQNLHRQGVIFEKPPTLNPTYNIYHCILHDPNGYLLEIQQFLDPNWPN